jgi:hypothetical protein
MASANSSRGAKQSRAATFEQMQKVVKDLQTAADLQNQAARSSQQTALNMAKALSHNQTSMDGLVSMLTGALGGQVGPTMAGVNTPGPMFGRSAMPQHQGAARPNGFPHQAYPGGTGYGMGTQGQPGHPMPSNGGGMGMMQGLAAQVLHNKFGMGNISHYQSTGQKNANGEDIYHAVGNNGSIIGTGTRDELASGALAGRSRISHIAAGVAGSGGFVEGGMRALSGIGGGLAGKILGGVGAGAEGAYKVGQFIGDQRKANSAYQSIYDGSNMAGMGQRFLQEGFKIKNIMAPFFGSSGLSGADSDKAFKGISAMGYQGGQRAKRLDFVTQNYTSMGMSVDDSLQLVSTASKTLTTSMQDLHNQLKQVSEMAKTTGQSAEVLRQSFIQNFSAASNTGFGASSGTIATAQTAMGPGLGRPFAGFSISGMTSSLQQTGITAAYAGYQNPGAFIAASSKDPLVAAKGMQGRINAALSGSLPQQIRTLIEQKVKAAGGWQALQQNPNLAGEIGMSDEIVNGINPYSVDAILSVQGIAHDSNDVRGMYGYLVMMVAQAMNGQGGAMEAIKNQVAQNNERTPTNAGGQYAAIKSSKNKDAISGSLAKGNVKYDPVIDKLTSGIGKTGVVQVNTAEGPQVVSVQEAAKNYRDQLANGTAVILSGENAGSTVGDVYGVEYNQDYGKTSDKKATGKSSLGKNAKAIMALGLTPAELGAVGKLSQAGGGDFAMTMAKSMAAHNASGGVGGNITVTMQPELAKFLGITTQGSSLVNGGAAKNAPPLQPTAGGGSSSGG